MEKQGRILIVDDNATCVDVLRRILRNDYRLETAGDGDECLAKVLEFKPHMVLLDIMMPGMDGYETCRRIKFGPLGGFVQIILVSCKDLTADRVRGYDALADDYVVKPFDHDELLSKVQAHFRMREMQTDPESLDNDEVLTRRCSLVNQMNRAIQERLVSARWKLRN
jgi:DNA-binding response OmpR family regulator